MRNISWVILSLSIFLLFFPFVAHAQMMGESAVEMTIQAPGKMGKIIPVPNDLSPSALFGQDHAYTVTFRGNGEAIINLRATLSNFEDTARDTVQFRVSKGEVTDAIAFQIIREPRCLRYADVKYDLNYADNSNSIEVPCLEFQAPNYYDYWWEKTQYLKATVIVDADTITVSLPKPIAKDESGSIVLYFRSNGIVKKSSFSTFEYSFDTLKVKEPIRNMTVGIMTDSEMVLKGAESQIDYRFDYAMPIMQGSSGSEKSSFISGEFDNYVNQIGQGVIVKNATYLQSLESFNIEGAFASSALRLYAKNILIGLLIMATLIAFIVGTILFLIKRSRKQTDSISTQKSQPNNSYSKSNTLLWGLLTSFISSLITIVYSAMLYGLMEFASRFYYYNNPTSMVISLLVIIFSIGVYLAAFIGPSIFIGIKRGLWWGIGTFAMTLSWLMIFLLIGMLFILLTQNSRSTYSDFPRPMMKEISR